jgi:hypothetical protein
MGKEYITIADLAEQIGITRIAVFKAGQRGVFPVENVNGKLSVDINNEDVKEYINKAFERKKGKVKAQVKVTAKKDTKKKDSVKEANQKTIENIKSVIIKPQNEPESGKPIGTDIPDDIIKKIDEGRLTAKELIGLPKVVVDKIKVYEQTKQIIQKRQQERRELISIKFVHLLFGKIYDIDLNEFMAIKTRVKSHLAKIFETNSDEKLLAAEKAIDEELWDTLRRIKFEFDKFLDKMDNAN